MEELVGGCACGAVRYALKDRPMIVHACHCRDCQRITGSAFVVNLWIERELIEERGAAPRSFSLTGGTGAPHEVSFCGTCGTMLWSRYRASPGDTRFVRGGTLDDPAAVRPDVHIFTRSKLPWVTLPEGAPAFEAMYEVTELWPAEMQARYRRHIAARG